jgi:hypothetical protein
LIIEILVFFFQRETIHGHGLASTEFACANSLSGIVFASIAYGRPYAQLTKLGAIFVPLVRVFRPKTQHERKE